MKVLGGKSWYTESFPFSDFAASSAEICEMKYFDELLEEYIKM